MIEANVRTLLRMKSEAGYPEIASMLSLMNSMSQSEPRPHRYIAPGMFESSVRKRSSLTRSSSRNRMRSFSSSVSTRSGWAASLPKDPPSGPVGAWSRVIP
jgi:hypothetical protein